MCADTAFFKQEQSAALLPLCLFTVKNKWKPGHVLITRHVMYVIVRKMKGLHTIRLLPVIALSPQLGGRPL